MDEVQKKLDLLNENLDYYLYYDGEEIKKQAAYELGMNEGAHERNLEIAKTLLQRKMTIQEIAEITHLSIEEIKELEETK